MHQDCNPLPSNPLSYTTHIRHYTKDKHSTVAAVTWTASLPTQEHPYFLKHTFMLEELSKPRTYTSRRAFWQGCIDTWRRRSSESSSQPHHRYLKTHRYHGKNGCWGDSLQQGRFGIWLPTPYGSVQPQYSLAGQRIHVCIKKSLVVNATIEQKASFLVLARKHRHAHMLTD